MSEEDRQDFFVSNYDGAEREKILEGVIDIDAFDDDLVFLTKAEGANEETYIYHVEENRLTKLNTKIPN